MAGRRVYGGGGCDDGGSISGVSSNHSVLLQNRGGSFASEPLNALFLSGSSSSTSPSLLGNSLLLDLFSSCLCFFDFLDASPSVELMVLFTLWVSVLLVIEKKSFVPV